MGWGGKKHNTEAGRGWEDAFHRNTHAGPHKETQPPHKACTITIPITSTHTCARQRIQVNAHTHIHIYMHTWLTWRASARNRFSRWARNSSWCAALTGNPNSSTSSSSVAISHSHSHSQHSQQQQQQQQQQVPPLPQVSVLSFLHVHSCMDTHTHVCMNVLLLHLCFYMGYI